MKKRKYQYAAPLGILFGALALIGLITVIWLSVNFTTQLLDNSKEKTNFERIIYPVMMFDPVPFDKIEDADPLSLLQASIWGALNSKGTSQTEDEMGANLLIPTSDVDVACAKLFGDVKLEHKGFTEYEITYYYDEEIAAYRIPIVSEIHLYKPRVETIEKKGDLFVLKVGYIPPGNAWTMDFSGETTEPDADKYMQYEMKKNKDTYQVAAIKDMPSESTGTVNTQPVQP